MQLKRIRPWAIVERLPQFDDLTALLIDPDPLLLESRRLLLMGTPRPWRLQQPPREVFDLQPAEAPEVALLSYALGTFQLHEVSEYVRHHWPHARILIVGSADPDLDDQLYDDALGEGFGPEDLLIAVERLSQFLRAAGMVIPSPERPAAR